MTNVKPDIYNYSNFRDYLKAACYYFKKTNPNFSYRYFAKKAGFSSASYLSLVIDGKRRLTNNFIPGFSKACGLNKKEQLFFDALVSFNQSETVDAKRYYLELMCNLRSNKVGKLLENGQYEYLSNWYYVAIRELITLPNFRENTAWIKQHLGNNVMTKEIRNAIEVLLQLGMIKRDENGRLVQIEKDIDTEENIKSQAAYLFHQQMLSLAKNMLAVAEQEKRELAALTMAISQRQFNEIKAMVKEFGDQVVRYLDNNPDVPDDIAQLNLQLFSMSAGGNGGLR